MYAILKNVDFYGEQCGSTKIFQTGGSRDSLLAGRTVRGALARRKGIRYIRRFLRSRA